MPLFSVIIPTYNRLHFLKETLASVQAQTFTDYEIIVVDDGSTDDTWDYLQTLAPAIRSFRQENKGPGAARNLGAQHATGTYLAFLDSDDLWFPWTLETVANLVSKSSLPLSFIRLSLIHFHDRKDLMKVNNKDFIAYKTYASFLEAFPEVKSVGSGHSIIKNSIFKSSGGYSTDIINSEDHDMAFKLGNASPFANVSNPMLVACRIHKEKTTCDNIKTYLGINYIINSERNNVYPGNFRLRIIRRIIIASHARSLSLALIQTSEYFKALDIFFKTFLWQALSLRVRYLLIFPIIFFIYIFLPKNIIKIVSKLITQNAYKNNKAI